MALEIKFGHQNFANYKRLAYKWWFALAEFVDNATQSYADHSAELDPVYAHEHERFTVIIATGQDFVRIRDNAMGMALEDLERAMVVGVPPADVSGRSRYGLGMKTAACWIGDKWRIVTTKLGDPREFTIEVDVNEIVRGNVALLPGTRDVDASEHYTFIEVSAHHRPLRGRTIGKVKEYLQSIYRRDISRGSMILLYNDAELEWRGFAQQDFLKRRDGTVHKKDFIFEIDSTPKKVVLGWVGVLEKGSRRKAGFSILHRDRLIKGWPDSWRPEKIFGPGGRNDLINQRVVGEINLEDFEVSHTKDEINWDGFEEEFVEQGLFAECKAFMDTARKRRVEDAEHGPTDVQVDAAVRTVEEEMARPEFLGALVLEKTLPPAEQLEANEQHVIEHAKASEPTFRVRMSDMQVDGYIDSTTSPNDPYFVTEDIAEDTVAVVINRRHPHWKMLEGENAVVNYLRHCVYDGVAEHRAARMNRLESESIRTLKDQYLRVAFQVLQSAADED